MNESGFNKFYWGFIFIMLNFRIQGFDILPDIVGYLFFASGFSALASNSTYFNAAARYNIPMIILSAFSIYQAPAQGGGIYFGHPWILGIFIMIAAFILDLLVAYNLFMGVEDMAEKAEQSAFALESIDRWNQYKTLKIASLLVFILVFIPPIALLYIIGLLIAAIILAISIAGFMKRCGENLRTLE